jgi:hypothetical protein
MNPTAIAVLTRNAALAAQEAFQRIYPGTPTPEQLRAVHKAMAEALTLAMRKFGTDAQLAPHNTEAHYTAAVLAIAMAGVQAIAFTKAPQAPTAPAQPGRKNVA